MIFFNDSLAPFKKADSKIELLFHAFALKNNTALSCNIH